VGLSGDFLAAFSGESSGPASLQSLVERMQKDEFDLIAVGRALISDADWVAKVRAGETDALKGFDASALPELI
jgi:2,4-dienoyl-CoA reductase-like NADH-dependent reductase (Old Yellow Enzyme family)